MADKKRTPNEEIEIEELTDEQANKAAGGEIKIRKNFTCDGCGKTFSGYVFIKGDKGYCDECYRKNKEISII